MLYATKGSTNLQEAYPCVKERDFCGIESYDFKVTKKWISGMKGAGSKEKC
jgi:hypothetical protein